MSWLVAGRVGCSSPRVHATVVVPRRGGCSGMAHGNARREGADQGAATHRRRACRCGETNGEPVTRDGLPHQHRDRHVPRWLEHGVHGCFRCGGAHRATRSSVRGATGAPIRSCRVASPGSGSYSPIPRLERRHGTLPQLDRSRPRVPSAIRDHRCTARRLVHRGTDACEPKPARTAGRDRLRLHAADRRRPPSGAGLSS